MKVYVDTNILVDLVCARENFLEDAQRLFALGYIGRIQLVVSALSFVNTVYIGRKYDRKQLVEKLREVSRFVDVVDLKGDVVLWALTSGWKDYEDATQSRTAWSESCDCVVTRNKKDFENSSVPVFLVKELLDTMVQ